MEHYAARCADISDNLGAIPLNDPDALCDTISEIRALTAVVGALAAEIAEARA
jgi:hypothetical protein